MQLYFYTEKNGEQAMQTNISFTGCSAYLGYANRAAINLELLEEERIECDVTEK